MAAPESLATTWWAGFKYNVKSLILEPQERLRVRERTSSSSFYSVDNEDDRTKSAREPDEQTTCTGFSELPPKTVFTIMLLWLTRFFIPWVAMWHEYNIRFLVDPEHIKTQEREILNQEMILFCGKCAITIFLSFIAGVRDMERSTYLMLLILYLSCPVAGGYEYSVLRSRLIDSELDSNWFMSTVLMRWTMEIPFMFFPVQLSSIFYEKENMSRQAHYNWVGVFTFLEFLNTYAAYWTIPGRCPTSEWTHIAVWVGIGFTLYTVVQLTIFFFFAKRGLTQELIECSTSCFDEQEGSEGRGSLRPTALTMAACYFCIFIPVIYTIFVFAVLQRFAPDEDWDTIEPLPATSMFYMGRIIGVAIMVVASSIIRKYGKKVTRLRLLRSDVLVLGLPHIFNIMALLVLFGRFTTLSHSEEDDAAGPIPDDTKTVVTFFNLIFRSRAVCVSSEDFRPLQIRPFHYATRKIQKPGMGSITFSVTLEPDTNPSFATKFEIGNLSKDGWTAISFSLVKYLDLEDNKETRLKNYNVRPVVTKQMVPQTHPENGSKVIILNTERMQDEEPGAVVYHLQRERQSHPLDAPDVQIPASEEGNAQLWNVSRPGNWSIRIQTTVNESNINGPWFDFIIDGSNSVYCLASYLDAPIQLNETWGSKGFSKPEKFKIFKITEAAGPGSRKLPSKQQLQVDVAIQTGLLFAGMAAGGVYAGIIYMFWTEHFIGTTMRFTITWVFMAIAEKPPQIKLVDIDWVRSSALSVLQIVLTILHFIGALYLYRPEFKAQIRPG